MQDNIHMDEVLGPGQLQSFYFHNIRNQISEKCTTITVGRDEWVNDWFRLQFLRH